MLHVLSSNWEVEDCWSLLALRYIDIVMKCSPVKCAEIDPF